MDGLTWACPKVLECPVGVGSGLTPGPWAKQTAPCFKSDSRTCCSCDVDHPSWLAGLVVIIVHYSKCGSCRVRQCLHCSAVTAALNQLLMLALALTAILAAAGVQQRWYYSGVPAALAQPRCHILICLPSTVFTGFGQQLGLLPGIRGLAQLRQLQKCSNADVVRIASSADLSMCCQLFEMFRGVHRLWTVPGAAAGDPGAGPAAAAAAG